MLDASAWVAGLADSGSAGDAARQVIAADPELVVPAHGRLEVVRTLARYEHAGLITGPVLAALLEVVLATAVREVVADDRMLRAIWQMRHNVSTYDAPYVAIAHHHGAPLVTCDGRLGRAAESFGVDVRLIA